jgi:hypothetical protein
MIKYYLGGEETLTNALIFLQLGQRLILHSVYLESPFHNILSLKEPFILTEKKALISPQIILIVYWIFGSCLRACKSEKFFYIFTVF